MTHFVTSSEFTSIVKLTSHFQFQEQRHLEEEYDEKLRIERKARDDDLGLTREERQKNREMMKELRAKRAAERAVEKEFTTDVIEQRAQMRGGKKEVKGKSLECNAD